MKSTILLLLSCSLLVTATPLMAADQSGSGGQLIDLETSERPLDVVLDWISRRAGVNIETHETDLPRVTIRLTNVTWQEAVDQIARRYDFVVEQRSENVWELTRPPKVRMEFQNAQLTVILDALARQAGVNIVISDSVSSDRRLTMKLSGVPWREALDVIVRTTGYEWIEGDYSIIRIVAPEDVQRDLQTRVVRLNYASAADSQTNIGVALSPDGQVQVDARTNSLILTDTVTHLERALAILEELDQRTQEVQIEIRFVEFTTTDALNWGFTNLGVGFDIQDFGTANALFQPLSSTVSTAFVDGAAQPSSSSLTSGSYAFEAAASLISSEVIQAPSILTLNNELAEISISRSQSFAEQTTTVENGTTVSRLQEAESSPLESGIDIGVTPHITDDGYVTMALEASDSTASLEPISVSGETIQLPDVRRKRVSTNIMVADGETAVIGGLLSNRVDETERWVPVLGNIPILGYLFRSKDDTVRQQNLTIFITPRIVQLDDRDELEEAKLRLREQLSGLDLDPADDQDGEFDAGP